MYTSDLIWDVAALIVSIFALVYIRKLYVKIRGGAYGKSYRYYYWAMIVFGIAFCIILIVGLTQHDALERGTRR